MPRAFRIGSYWIYFWVTIYSQIKTVNSNIFGQMKVDRT